MPAVGLGVRSENRTFDGLSRGLAGGDLIGSAVGCGTKGACLGAWTGEGGV